MRLLSILEHQCITSHDQSGPEYDYPVNNGDGNGNGNNYWLTTLCNPPHLFIQPWSAQIKKESSSFSFYICIPRLGFDSFVVFSTYHSLIPSCLNCYMFLFYFFQKKKTNTFRTMFPQIPPAHTHSHKKKSIND